ncbi:hypothetical protein [Yersinia aleksiciae]|uniref:hypothetical protein n=1 Tax=Yersinia aleksiciae TaxID=263819 RepID=UPI001427A192|nr:hypothetical protein [Yersinia aleksiciae]MDA5498012.1 hypothetical protein [Yersinia aleksiciae]NIL00987.1 hypothetical protein [Yersinia aleksiciae]WQC71629.1 hypothetical protein N0K21_03950 [Yersinia aleksiciae]
METEIIKQIDELQRQYYEALRNRKAGLCILAVIIAATGLDLYFRYSNGVVGYIFIGVAICFCVMESDKASKSKRKLNGITNRLFGKEYENSLREVADYKNKN